MGSIKTCEDSGYDHHLHWNTIMHKFILLVSLAFAAADRLENTYLPPQHAGTSGGSGSFLSAPSSSYGPPASGPANSRFGGQNLGQNIGIVRLNNDNDGSGNYHYEYETENRISAQETGQIKNLGSEQANQVQGSYSYTGPDGVTYTVTYVADENGFRATGAHIPTPPPIPDAILKSLSTSNGQTQSRQYLAPRQSGYNY